MHIINRHSRMLLAGIQVLTFYKLDSRLRENDDNRSSMEEAYAPGFPLKTVAGMTG